MPYRLLAFNVGVVLVCLLGLTMPEFAALATAAGGPGLTEAVPKVGFFARMLGFTPYFLLGMGLAFGWFFFVNRRSA